MGAAKRAPKRRLSTEIGWQASHAATPVERPQTPKGHRGKIAPANKKLSKGKKTKGGRKSSRKKYTPANKKSSEGKKRSGGCKSCQKISLQPTQVVRRKKRTTNMSGELKGKKSGKNPTIRHSATLKSARKQN